MKYANERFEMMNDYSKAIDFYSNEEYDKASSFMLKASKAASQLATLSKNSVDSNEYQTLANYYAKKASFFLEQKTDSIHRFFISELPTKGFSDFVGYDTIKKYLQDTIITPWKEHRFYTRDKNGLLIYGPHGVSKTRFAHALIKELGAKTYYFQPLKHFDLTNFADVEHLFIKVFKESRKEENVVYFIESPFPFFPRGEDDNSKDIASLFIRLFKKELKRAKRKKKNLLLVATTSVPDKLSYEAMRKGMFDDFIRMHRLNEEGRRELIRRYFKQKEISFEQENLLVEKTQGFVTTDISRLCKEIIKNEEKKVDDILDTFCQEDISGYQNTVETFEKAIQNFNIIEN